MGRKRKINEKTDEPADDAEDAEASDSSGPEFEGFNEGGNDSDNDSIANLEISDVESGEED